MSNLNFKRTKYLLTCATRLMGCPDNWHIAIKPQKGEHPSFPFNSLLQFGETRNKFSLIHRSLFSQENFGTMIGTNFMDEIDCGNFFENIDDLLDFPTGEDDVEAALGSADCNKFPTLWSNQSESLPGTDSVFSAGNSASDLSAELSVPVSFLLFVCFAHTWQHFLKKLKFQIWSLTS